MCMGQAQGPAMAALGQMVPESIRGSSLATATAAASLGVFSFSQLFGHLIDEWSIKVGPSQRFSTIAKSASSLSTCIRSRPKLPIAASLPLAGHRRADCPVPAHRCHHPSVLRTPVAHVVAPLRAGRGDSRDDCSTQGVAIAHRRRFCCRPAKMRELRRGVHSSSALQPDVVTTLADSNRYTVTETQWRSMRTHEYGAVRGRKDM